MARTPKKTDNPPTIVTDADTPTLPAMVEAHDQFNQQLAVIDAQFGGGEFEITTYNRERVLNECKFFLGQSAQAMLETGKRLILLKEHEPHGEFIRIVEERLGIENRVARRMMTAALKFLDPKRAALTVLGRAKIYELMVLDDEELDALAEGGTVAGYQQSDIERMTTRELHAALRESRENESAKDRLLADKNTKIDELAAKLGTREQKIKPADPDEEGGQLREETGMFAFRAEVAILGDLTKGFEALAAHAEKHDCTHEEFMSGCLAQIERALLGLRSRFDVKAFPDGQERPLWARDDVDTDAVVAAALRKTREEMGLPVEQGD